MTGKLQSMTPKEIVSELDKYIIGQEEAKKSVAIALRNRYRRSLLPDKMREEITPKNILMMGPTGCGKTEIARRLAKLMKAPFVKVEATKFTEVGYVGRDVDSMIRDLAEASVRITAIPDEREFSLPSPPLIFISPLFSNSELLLPAFLKILEESFKP